MVSSRLFIKEPSDGPVAIRSNEIDHFGSSRNTPSTTDNYQQHREQVVLRLAGLQARAARRRMAPAIAPTPFTCASTTLMSNQCPTSDSRRPSLPTPSTIGSMTHRSSNLIEPVRQPLRALDEHPGNTAHRSSTCSAAPGRRPPSGRASGSGASLCAAGRIAPVDQVAERQAAQRHDQRGQQRDRRMKGSSVGLDVAAPRPGCR